MTIPDPQSFIRANTRIRRVPLVDEISLYLADEAVPLWQKTEKKLNEDGLPPPFWAFAWAGGQALARYVLDHTDCVRGKRVLDLASGSGLVAIAAMKAGARETTAADIDAFALAAVKAERIGERRRPPLPRRQSFGRPLAGKTGTPCSRATSFMKPTPQSGRWRS